MFGRAEWFRLGRRGRPRPKTWRGRFYSLAWLAAIGVPTLVLIAAERFPECLIWPLAMGAMWRYDFRPIRQAFRPRPDVFVIDDTTDITHLATAHGSVAHGPVARRTGNVVHYFRSVFNRRRA